MRLPWCRKRKRHCRLHGNVRKLFDLNAGTLDNVGPLRDLGFDERFYVRKRHAERDACVGRNAFFYIAA
jgi:hypothetical protein